MLNLALCLALSPTPVATLAPIRGPIHISPTWMKNSSVVLATLVSMSATP